jgi:hypothetical protein
LTDALVYSTYSWGELDIEGFAGGLANMVIVAPATDILQQYSFLTRSVLRTDLRHSDENSELDAKSKLREDQGFAGGREKMIDILKTFGLRSSSTTLYRGLVSGSLVRDFKSPQKDSQLPFRE